jgi:transcriptional regulator
MYIPPAFQELDQAKLFDAIERHSFGLLVSQLDGELFATHLPLLVDRQAGPSGQLLGHMARANPQWQRLNGQTVLAVFSGPHAYITPTWYEAENVVPTWNYVAVHVYGKCEVIDDDRATAKIVEDYVATFERNRPKPWTIDSDVTFFEKLVKMVVGFRIKISRIEGKWKLSQNHPTERREKVARQLAEENHIDDQAIGRLMAETLSGKSG